MSAFTGALARPHPAREMQRVALLVGVSAVILLLAAGIASAELPPGVTRLSAADAERAGATIGLVRHTIGASSVVEVRPQAAEMTLLAVSPDGSQVALADQVGEIFGALTLARADGSQLRVQLPGLLAAGFAAEGAWLVVIDGRGALWRLATDSGQATPIADGPFAGSPIADADGSLLLLAVPSVDAPYRSQLVRLDQATGASVPLSGQELVYAAFPMGDGSLAIVAHEPGGTVVHQLNGGEERMLANLGPGATNAAAAPDGRRIAFERGDEGIFILDAPGMAPRSLGTGSRPCFAPDGASLLVRRGEQTVVIGLDGRVLAAMDQQGAFVGSTGCLP
jgi:hypothetical protein